MFVSGRKWQHKSIKLSMAVEMELWSIRWANAVFELLLFNFFIIFVNNLIISSWCNCRNNWIIVDRWPLVIYFRSIGIYCSWFVSFELIKNKQTESIQFIDLCFMLFFFSDNRNDYELSGDFDSIWIECTWKSKQEWHESIKCYL